MSYASSIKQFFPYLNQHHKDLVYLDNAATVHKPQVVIDAVGQAMTHWYAPIYRGIYPQSEDATARYEAVRHLVAARMHASPHEIIFCPSATYGLNLIAFAWARQVLKPQDCIVITMFEHHANLIPWQQLAAATGTKLLVVPIKNFELDLTELDRILISNPVKIVAFSAMSNSIGTLLPVQDIIKKARAVAAYTIVDACQVAAYEFSTLASLDADFIVFSGHKLGAPTGVGVVRAKEKHYAVMQPYIFGGGMVAEVTFDTSSFLQPPRCFEPGTPPFEAVIGLGAALEFMATLDFAALIHERKQMMRALITGLQLQDDIIILGNPAHLIEKGHIVSFSTPQAHAHDVAAYLGAQNIAVRAGHHCAQPLAEQLQCVASVRVSLFWYNTMEDVERFNNGLNEALSYLKR